MILDFSFLIGTNDIVDWAMETGFGEDNVVRFTASLMKLGSLLTTGHFGERAMETAILTK